MSWARKPRVYKRELVTAVDKAFMEQRILLTALGLIASWSKRWKAAAKEYKRDTRALNACIEDNVNDIRDLQAENEALLRRVSDLEAEVSALYHAAEQ